MHIARRLNFHRYEHFDILREKKNFNENLKVIDGDDWANTKTIIRKCVLPMPAVVGIDG